MKILVLPNYTKPSTKEVLKKVLRILDYNKIDYCVSCSNIDFHPQVIIAIGGDGTFIRSVKHASQFNAAVVGINTGNVGYLAEIDLSNLEEKLYALLKGEYRTESRIALSAQWNQKAIGIIINDIVFTAVRTLNNFKVEIEGIEEYTYRSTGLIISTPTGSTAYNYAAGGPVLFKDLNLVCITPICPQSGNVRSFVVDADRRIRISSDGEIRVSCDGEEMDCLRKNDIVKVSLSKDNTNMIIL